ncbi:DUF423 domain-containing protein [Moraxella nasovis]|uniref:DUF423 domain-containing protein n=1 Tax=Moraxella nasovis TaxID=2904121 RepID=UPI001F60703F|nr:DUF423 domain-containing protein [Moraxella nasovis]UNU74267.1 DUF423 domain-containing protein [Moraxella nasovis]
MWLKTAALNLAIGVGLGAFGAHGLQGFADPYAIEIWHTATLYLFVHALGLLAIGVLNATTQYRISLPAYLLQAGIVIFSGTLYAMALGAPKWLGMITPIGGTLMIMGWLTLTFGTLHKQGSTTLPKTKPIK